MRRYAALLPTLSVLAALLLTLLPLPDTLVVWRPYWLALVLAYWALELPERVGLGYAFVVGLLADLVHGGLWGEQALRLLVLVFIVLRLRNRLRLFPMWQQSVGLTVLLLNDRIIALVIRLGTGLGWPDPAFWLSPLSTLLLWPVLFLLLDDLRLRVGLRA